MPRQSPARAALLACLIAIALAASPLRAQAPDGAAEAQALVDGGAFFGTWPDGRQLFEAVRVIAPDLITLARPAYSAPPVAYIRVSPGLYRSAAGSTIRVAGSDRLIWSDGSGEVTVEYDRVPDAP